ncbi:DUF4296 domain-containing protein [Saccharicrinis sp. GN24d3]|uniref:DUF4296 domain-containing protein n=1 Tax=Saccharicrinis sp. GN24d3 TaxID=3458416 RepID=UPI004035B0FB
MKTRTIGIVLVVAALLASCKQDRLPNGFPDKDEFAEILSEVHLTEAIINQMRIKNRGIDSTANNYYHHVLAKFNLTQEKFDTIVNWYLAHPEIYQDVYDESIAMLSEKQAEWQREVKGIEDEIERKRKEKEARNVWKDKKNYFISLKDTFDRRIPFELNVDTIEAESYRVSAFYQFLKGSRVEKPTLEVMAFYEDSTLDTLTYKLHNTHISTKAELMIGLNKDLKILRIEGYLVKHDTMEEIRARIKDIEFVFQPKVDSLEMDSVNIESFNTELPKIE